MGVNANGAVDGVMLTGKFAGLPAGLDIRTNGNYAGNAGKCGPGEHRVKVGLELLAVDMCVRVDE
jgi:hypothetical protein